MSQTTLSHVDQNGQANMVDVTSKQATSRQASAMARVMMKSETLDMIASNQHAKGDVLAVSRIAGIQAAKKCADLIPLCHPLMLTKVAIDFNVDREKGWVEIQSLCRLTGQTGVEMEALTAVSVAALTLFDMCKAVDPHMVITEMKVLTKQGGKSGDWQREVNS